MTSIVHHAATNSVTSYINKIDSYILIHIVIFTAYKPHTVYKNIFALYVSQNVTAHYIAPPIFVYMEYVSLPTTLCIYNIEPQTLYQKPHKLRRNLR